MPQLPQVAVELADALTGAGFPQMPARVFSALLADADGQMTAAELQSSLAISAGGVSGAIGYLERLDLVSRERVRGTRREVYTVQDDAWHDVVLNGGTAYQPMIAALERGIAAGGADDPARLRLELSREFLVFVGEEMEAMAERWETRKAGLLGRRR